MHAVSLVRNQFAVIPASIINSSPVPKPRAKNLVKFCDCWLIFKMQHLQKQDMVKICIAMKWREPFQLHKDKN